MPGYEIYHPIHSPSVARLEHVKHMDRSRGKTWMSSNMWIFMKGRVGSCQQPCSDVMFWDNNTPKWNVAWFHIYQEWNSRTEQSLRKCFTLHWDIFTMYESSVDFIHIVTITALRTCGVEMHSSFDVISSNIRIKGPKWTHIFNDERREILLIEEVKCFTRRLAGSIVSKEIKNIENAFKS